jgi:hypothetical protein
MLLQQQRQQVTRLLQSPSSAGGPHHSSSSPARCTPHLKSSRCLRGVGISLAYQCCFLRLLSQQLSQAASGHGMHL